MSMNYIIHALSMNLRRAARYRASFAMQTIAQIVMTAGDLWALLVLTERFGGMGHWSAYEVMFFFGGMHIAFALCEAFTRGIDHFSAIIRSGDFDTFLIRPRSLLMQVILNEADPRRFGSVAVGLCALIVSSAGLRLVWTWWKLALLLWSVFGTVWLLSGIFLIDAVLTFFTVQSTEFVNIFTYGGRQACQYPVDLYPGWIRFTFTYVIPIAACLQYPISMILGRTLIGNPPPALVWLLPLAGPAFFGLVLLLWRLGVRHYRSTGS